MKKISIILAVLIVFMSTAVPVDAVKLKSSSRRTNISTSIKSKPRVKTKSRTKKSILNSSIRPKNRRNYTTRIYRNSRNNIFSSIRRIITTVIMLVLLILVIILTRKFFKNK